MLRSKLKDHDDGYMHFSSEQVVVEVPELYVDLCLNLIFSFISDNVDLLAWSWVSGRKIDKKNTRLKIHEKLY